MSHGSALKRGSARVGIAPRGLGNAGGFAAKADMRSGDLVVALAGDSTGDEYPEWFSKGFDLWLADHPWVTCQYMGWQDNAPNYPVIAKATSNIAASTVFSDSFNRTAADLYASTPDTGASWIGGGNAAGSWSLNGTKAVAAVNGNPGNLIAVHGIYGDTTVAATGITINTATARGSFSLLGKYVDNATQIYLYVAVNSSGVSTFGLWRIVNGVSAAIAIGSGNPLPASTTTTFNMSLSVKQLTVTGVVNGLTVTGSISGRESQLLAPSTQGGMAATSGMAGMTVDQFTITGQPGMQNLRMWNGSKAGSRLEFQTNLLARMYPEPIDLLFVSSTHNYTSDTAATYPGKVQRFIEGFRNLHPETGIVLVSQNPEFPPSTGHQQHAARTATLRKLASEYGYDYLPAAEEFLAQPDRGQSLVRSDGVHPTGGAGGEPADPLNGSYLWGTVLRRFLNGLSSLPSANPFGFTYTVDPGIMRAGDGLPVPAANSAVYLRVREPATINKIALQVIGATSGNISVGVYRNNGAGRSSVPGTLLASSGSIACPALGYAEVALPTTVQVRSGDWLAISCDNITAKFFCLLTVQTPTNLGLGRQYTQANAHPLPATPSGLTATLGNTLCLIGSM